MNILSNKKIMFLTGTRADFGHQKPLIDKCIEVGCDVSLFITGMHLDVKYGETIREIDSYGYDQYYAYRNHKDEYGFRYESMDMMLSETICGFSQYVKQIEPDLIVIYADRFEALAGAIVGALNNILTLHVQAGDVSGTIDDSMRHAISKLCHAHFTANQDAKNRLINMGEVEENIEVIGTPGLDVLFSDSLPLLEDSKKKYDINFDDYAILIFHPVTTEVENLSEQVDTVIDSIIESGRNYIVICPNNDLGSDKIFNGYDRFKGNDNIKIFTSIDHYDFLILLKNAEFIIGNSSCGIIEAPFYGVHTINIGSRQHGRTSSERIMNCECDKNEILEYIKYTDNFDVEPDNYWGDSHTADKFIEVLGKNSFWRMGKQKVFNLCI